MSFQIAEPATILTDYALAAAALFLGQRLLRLARAQRRTCVWLWACGFLCAVVAAVAGGTYHGLVLYLSSGVRRALWSVAICFIGAAGAFMVAGTKASTIRRRDESARWLMGGFLLSLAGFAIQQSGVQLHRHFNHNDLYHVIQTGALYLFYRGASLLTDALTTSTSRRSE